MRHTAKKCTILIPKLIYQPIKCVQMSTIHKVNISKQETSRRFPIRVRLTLIPRCYRQQNQSNPCCLYKLLNLPGKPAGPSDHPELEKLGHRQITQLHQLFGSHFPSCCHMEHGKWSIHSYRLKIK